MTLYAARTDESLSHAVGNAELMRQNSNWKAAHARLTHPVTLLAPAEPIVIQADQELPEGHHWLWPLPRDIDETMAILLEYWMLPRPKLTVNVARIKAVVAEDYGVTVLDIDSRRREQAVVVPRHVAIYLAKVLTHCSMSDIGRRVGDRDHTSAIFAVRKIERLVAKGGEFAARVARLKANIERGV